MLLVVESAEDSVAADCVGVVAEVHVRDREVCFDPGHFAGGAPEGPAKVRFEQFRCLVIGDGQIYVLDGAGAPV